MDTALSKRVVKVLFWLLLILPSALALLWIRPADLASASGVLNLLGRLAGIAGLSCLLLAAALIVRVPGFDRLFGGLTKLWQLHHRLGAASLLLLLAHPLLLALAAAEVSLTAAVYSLFPPRDGFALWLGWAALLLMMVFLAPSFAFFGEPDYQRWKWLHRLSGPAVLLALWHTLLLARSMPAPWQALIWGGLALLAVAAVSYRFVFSRGLGRQRYRVRGVTHPANNVVEISLQPEGKPLRYQAGQFVYLTPYDRGLAAGYAEEHPYTLSSAPDEPYLRIAIKDLGDASRAIQQIAPDSAVTVEGPYGDFFPAQTGRELWIAGGIGITPFLARLRHLAATVESTDVHLVFCVQDDARALFRDELKKLAASLPGFTLTLHYFFREGPLSSEFLLQCCPDCNDRRAFICGPTPLIELARNSLLTAGVPRGHIHSEEFVLL